MTIKAYKEIHDDNVSVQPKPDKSRNSRSRRATQQNLRALALNPAMADDDLDWM